MTFDYPSLAALAAVIREGSFEAAATALNVTQSAISQRIKQAETRAGARLIIRGRPCVPTEQGQILFRHAKRVETLERELEFGLELVSRHHSQTSAIMHIAVDYTSLATWFPKAITRTAAQLQLHLHVIADDQQMTTEMLKNGAVLAAITTEGRPLPGCRRVPLGAIDYVAVAAPAYVDRQFAAGVTIQSVAQATLLALSRGDALSQMWLLHVFDEAVPLAGHILPSFSACLGSCLSGAGWSVLPRHAVAQALVTGALVELIPKTPVVVPLYWQSGVTASERMAALAKIVAEVAREFIDPA